jgi:hypothetical protein
LFQTIVKEYLEHDVNVQIIDNHEKDVGQKSCIGNVIILVNGGHQDKELFQEINTEHFHIFEENRGHTNDFRQNFTRMYIFKVELVMVQDVFEQRTCGIFRKRRDDFILKKQKSGFRQPIENVNVEQPLDILNKDRLVFVFKGVDDFTVIFRNIDIL